MFDVVFEKVVQVAVWYNKVWGCLVLIFEFFWKYWGNGVQLFFYGGDFWVLFKMFEQVVAEFEWGLVVMYLVCCQYLFFWVVFCSGGILLVLNVDFCSVGSNWYFEVVDVGFLVFCFVDVSWLCWIGLFVVLVMVLVLFLCCMVVFCIDLVGCEFIILLGLFWKLIDISGGVRVMDDFVCWGFFFEMVNLYYCCYEVLCVVFVEGWL